MPIKKFRDVSEMKNPVHVVGSATLFETTRSIWAFAQKVCPLRFPPGVYKHRSIEDAELLRKQWQLANVTAQQARIRKQ